jgi:hypothetical protein
VGLIKYFKEAFLFHWNLLAFAGAMGFALLSGHPDVGIPLVFAGEAAYLGLLATNPRYQRSVDAQEAKADRQRASAESVDRLLQALPAAQVRRFQSLRRRCLELRQIAQQMRDTQGIDPVQSLDDMQLTDLDRLLWTDLRMLYTEYMLDRFLESTSVEQLQAEITRIERRIAGAAKDPNSPATQRILPTLQEGLETARARLANREKARENRELLQVEIESLEAKIQSINEMAINRHDPDFIRGQVDQIVRGLVRTEQTMNDLEVASGGQAFDATVPKILLHEIAPDAANEAEEEPRRQRQTEDGIHFL